MLMLINYGTKLHEHELNFFFFWCTIQKLTIKDQRGNWFDPHLCVNQVRSARFLGAALPSHHFSNVGSLVG